MEFIRRGHAVSSGQTDSSSMAGTVRREFRSYHIGCVGVVEEEIPAHIAEVRGSLFLYLSEGGDGWLYSTEPATWP